ncbi:hypothetical protein, partial [Dickeya dianthicola]|uniref:hypothetical protein n=1 Tax=Dickeya dianthicola TaxID=204039 RepID=UPI001F386930
GGAAGGPVLWFYGPFGSLPDLSRASALCPILFCTCLHRSTPVVSRPDQIQGMKKARYSERA